ncbi:MAG: formyltetrahydrofolate deformylase, partial [Chlamydiales bacterium]|nr:formyltetrahydrofolate deformylase [Chlamydiales bacterium]
MNKITLTLTCPDRVGIVAAVTGFLAANNGFIIESAQVGDSYSQLFFMRVVFTIDSPVEEVERLFSETAKTFQMQAQFTYTNIKPKVLIMCSKQGHCLNALLNKYAMGVLPIEVPAVVSNHSDLAEMCSWYRIPFHHLPVTPDNKETQERKVLDLVDEHQVDLVVLARYMQILTPEMTQALWGKCINIHHSFLPSF